MKTLLNYRGICVMKTLLNYRGIYEDFIKL